MIAAPAHHAAPAERPRHPPSRRPLTMALTIKAIEDWDATIAESDEKLLVIDCHQEWCGRCATLEPALTKV